MPIYEYRCSVCGSEEEVRLSFEEMSLPQVCGTCGKPLKREVSVPNIVIKQTGRDMALDTLNSKSGGMPNGHNKAFAEKMAARGL